MHQAKASRDSGTGLISIRKATSQDAPGILECLRAAFEDYRHLYTPAAFLDTVLTSETIQVRLAKMVVFVAVNSSSEIIGTIACEVLKPGEGYLRGMAVLPAWRGTGLASQLLSCAESELHSRNCARITLDTTEPLLRAMGFYEKHGYRRSGRISDFFGMALIEYEKTLPPSHRTWAVLPVSLCSAILSCLAYSPLAARDSPQLLYENRALHFPVFDSVRQDPRSRAYKTG